MELIKSLESFTCGASVASVGNFDGIHQGHELLIDEVVRRARDKNVSGIIITFDPHTRAIIDLGNKPLILTTLEEKSVLIGSKGVDYLICLNFNKELKEMEYTDFVDSILIKKLGVNELIMGEGHTFGRSRQGSNSLHHARDKMHFSTFVINSAESDGKTISSTEIRRKISDGRISEAVQLLGHPYLIISERISGKKMGTELGYPTLNFRGTEQPKVTPLPGVYAARIQYKDKTYTGALYYGICPTFSNREAHYEFHSFDTLKDIPSNGENAYMWLHEFIRPDQTFATGSQLKVQIDEDVKEIKDFFLREK